MGCFVIYSDVLRVIENPPAHKVSFGILRSTKCIENKWQRYVRIAYSGERMVYQSFGSHGTRKSTCNGQSTGQAFTEPCHVFHYGIEHYVHCLIVTKPVADLVLCRGAAETAILPASKAVVLGMDFEVCLCWHGRKQSRVKDVIIYVCPKTVAG